MEHWVKSLLPCVWLVTGLLGAWRQVMAIRTGMLVRNLTRQHTYPAVKELARLALESKNERIRITAIRELLDRSHEKMVPMSSGDTKTSGWLASQ